MVTSGPSDHPTESRRLPRPEPGRHGAEAFVAAHLGHLMERRVPRGPMSSPTYRGGQQAAEAALARFDVTGFRVGQETVYPQRHRHAPVLWPWVRHGLLSLGRLYRHVVDGPADDVAAFRAALLAEEAARLWYGRQAATGERTPAGATQGDNSGAPAAGRGATSGWDRRLACVALPLEELVDEGWLPPVARDWLAHQWVRRHDPDIGADLFRRHLLDGTQARNRLDWLAASARAGDPTALSRWQIERLAPGLCADCELVAACPLDHEIPPLTGHPVGPATTPPPATHLVTAAATATISSYGPSGQRGVHPAAHLGPASVSRTLGDPEPEAVWLTAESLGDADPALAAHPDLPAVFVFDEPLLARLRLSPKRLAFFTETLADLASRRPIEVWLGQPAEVLSGRPVAATFTPVPGWHRRSNRVPIVEIHPWPWLFREMQGSGLNYPERAVASDRPVATESSAGRNNGALV